MSYYQQQGAPYGHPGYQAPPQAYGQPPPQAPGAYGQQQAYGQQPYGAPQPGGPPPGGAPPPGAYGGAPAPGGYGQPPPQQHPPQGAPPPQQGGEQQLQMWFQSIDTDRSGQLDANELQRALSMGNLKFGLTDVDAMVRAFDTRGERKLNLQEFSKLHGFLTSIQASFTYFDSDRTNTLAQNEVVAALRQAGFNLDPPVVTAMMSRHDPDNTKTLSLDEFIRACLFLQSCVRTFSAFDSQRQGRVTLDFGQFVYACSHIS